MPTRLERIEEIGLRAYDSGGATPNKSLVKAFAAMLDEAVATRTKGPKRKFEPEKLPYGPGAVFDSLERTCPEAIQLRPYETKTFGRLARNMCGIQGLELADLERTTQWIANGGLKFWTVAVTWNHLVKHYGSWVAQARQWEANGGALVANNHPAEFKW